MTDSNYTAIAIVVDRSGSMWSMQADAQGGINAFIADQAKQEGKATIRIDQFDQTYENVMKSVDVKDAGTYNLVPRGSTALLDAIGKTVVDFGEELAALDEAERPGKVIVVVVTDGYENSSVEYTNTAIAALIKEQEQTYGWEFVFLAANQDAVTVGADYGFKADNSLTYSVAAVGNTYNNVSQMVTRTRMGNTAGFTSEERATSI